MKPWNVLAAALCISLVPLLSIGTLQAQHDAGPRTDTAGAGGPLPTLNADEQSLFLKARDHFKEINSVDGKVDGEESIGLGPTFNGNSCAMCHAAPAVGGTSPSLNPQVALATLQGATNTVPSFITAGGPVREARFVRKGDGSLDGGVHGLFTIAGRSDAPGCKLKQPDFAAHLAVNNVIFRIPTPVFGLGLVEATPDARFQANLASNKAAKRALGIYGSLNTNGNDGTVTRFGWKAQNKSLLIFAAEAYNVEQGVTNEGFPNDRALTPDCDFNGLEDASPLDGTTTDLTNFAIFMQLSAPPTPALPQEVTASSVQNGSSLFSIVGCALCHTPSLTTGRSPLTGISNLAYSPFSDFALHHMGSGLADGINQGTAGPDQFRTAPLWGVGQRLFFLHDGRTSDLLQAIKAHADCTGDNRGHGNDQDRDHRRSNNCGSEAYGVINNFNALSPLQQQDILNFLRSL